MPRSNFSNLLARHSSLVDCQSLLICDDQTDAFMFVAQLSFKCIAFPDAKF